MKKQIAMLLSLGMLATSAMPASAVFKQGKVVSYFDSALGYKSTSTDQTLPAGWETLYNPGHTDEVARAKKVDSMFDEDINSNVIVLNGSSTNFGAAMRYIFDEVIQTGKVHVGFDMKVTDGQRVRFGGHFVQSGNYNPNDHLGVGYDANGTPNSYWDEKNTYLLIENNAAYTYEPANMDIDANKKPIAGATVSSDIWYRYDIYLDTQEQRYDIYRDGDHIGNYDLSRYLLKSFWFQCDTGTAYLDNVCFEHYQNGDFDTMRAAIDYNSEGIALSNGVVIVSFSEPLANEPTDDCFVIKDASGAVVEGVIDYATNLTENTVELGLSDILAGTYTLEVSDSVKGKISQTSASNVMTFTTVPTEISGANYYLNEDFEDYIGGMPTGWGKGDSNGVRYGYSTGDINIDKMTSGIGNNGGTAIEFPQITAGDRSIEYKFPTEIHDGKFTIEFDVYHDPKAQWSVSLFTPAEYRTDLVPTTAQATDPYDALATRRNNSILFAQYQAEGDSTYSKICVGKALTSWYDDRLQNGTAPGSEWTHIKAVIDADANQYRVETTNSSGTTTDTITGVTRLARQTLYNTTTATEEKIYGVAGIMFMAKPNPEAGTVKFDNIKVYSNADKPYNMYEDYNTLVSHNDYTSGETIPYNSEIIPSNGQWDYIKEYNKGNGDKALLFATTSGQDRLLYQKLSVPVKAGKSFKMEFDVKNDAVPNNSNDTEGQWELVLGNWDEVKNQTYIKDLNRILGRNANDGKLRVKLNESASWTVTDTSWKTGEWHHFDIYVNHDTVPSQMTINVTFEDGTSSQVYNGNAPDDFMNLDTQYFGIRTSWRCSSYIYIDNVKIYEVAPKNSEVMSVKAIGYDGTKNNVESTVSAASSGLEINLNQPIENTDAVKLVYPNIGTTETGRTINCTKTLSNGGRTINIIFDELPKLNENIAVEIEQNAVFANSYVTNFNTYNKVFKLVESAGGEITINDFRVYMYEEERTDGNGHVYPAAWVPYFGDRFTDLQEDDIIRLHVEGYNTGDEQQIIMSGNNYITVEEGVKGLDHTQSEIFTVKKGIFERNFEVSNNINSNSFKGLLWQYPSLAPLTEPLEYDR